MFLSLTERLLSLFLIKLLFNPVSLKDSFREVCQALGLFSFLPWSFLAAVGMKLGDQEYSTKIVIKKALLLTAEGERRGEMLKKKKQTPFPQDPSSCCYIGSLHQAEFHSIIWSVCLTIKFYLVHHFESFSRAWFSMWGGDFAPFPHPRHLAHFFFLTSILEYNCFTMVC